MTGDITFSNYDWHVCSVKPSSEFEVSSRLMDDGMPLAFSPWIRKKFRNRHLRAAKEKMIPRFLGYIFIGVLKAIPWNILNSPRSGVSSLLYTGGVPAKVSPEIVGLLLAESGLTDRSMMLHAGDLVEVLDGIHGDALLGQKARILEINAERAKCDFNGFTASVPLEYLSHTT